MVVLCVATLWVTTKNAPFSDRNKSFQIFLKTFEIASSSSMIRMIRNESGPYAGLIPFRFKEKIRETFTEKDFTEQVYFLYTSILLDCKIGDPQIVFKILQNRGFIRILILECIAEQHVLSVPSGKTRRIFSGSSGSRCQKGKKTVAQFCLIRKILSSSKWLRVSRKRLSLR